MDFRRLLLALSLSFVFIFVWQTFFMPAPPMEQSKEQAGEAVDLNNNAVDMGTFKDNNTIATLELGSSLNITTQLVSIDLNNCGTSINLSLIHI